MALISWKTEEVPNGMEIKQVYGLIFTKDGRIMLRTEQKKDRIKYSLAGGHPEPLDIGIEGTCRRELIEEVNTTIHKPIYVGYQLVDEEDGSPLYAQVRMTALIDVIGPVKPDSDNGKTYGRFLTSPKRAAELLNWGEVGFAQILSATNIIEREFGIVLSNLKEEYV